ncbi:MAG: Ig-like domain-containing protein [Reichenbachiella sp.]|uniref:Ig-like domain-containing protein n=1 Tax=Reichenbachiella sp. TaxID=2184521 RepID=UPI00329A53F4
MSKLKFIIGSLMISSLFVGCTEDEKVDITGISFNGDTIIATEGVSYDVSEELNISGGDADQANIVFSSGDANVVSVDGTILTAEAVGTTTLTATETNTDLTATVNVEVIAKVVAVTGITLDKETEDLKVGETLQLAATIAPADATEQGVTWTVAFPSESKTKEDVPTDIATVSDAGLVTAIAAGDVVVTATSKDGGFAASATLSITNVDITSLEIVLADEATYAIAEGNDGFTPVLSIEPANATIKTVTWSLEYTPVLARTSGEVTADYYATVDTETGVVTGKNECIDCGLELVATATEGGKQAKVRLDIDYIEVTGLQLEQASYFTITAGETEQMAFTVVPKNANDQNPNVSWSIETQDSGECVEVRTQIAVAPDYSDYATVDENGLITAVKNYSNPCSNLAIVAQIEGVEGTTSAQFDVENVVATSVTIDQGESLTLEEGESITLSATVAPSNTTNPDITWSTYDPTEEARVAVSCLEVSPEGVVSAGYCSNTYTVYAYNSESELVDSIDITVEPCVACN